MKTLRVLSGVLLLSVVLLTGYSSVTAGDLTGVQRMMEVPAVRQVAQVQIPVDPTPPEPVTLLNAEMHVLHSENTGLDYRIYVWLPPGYGTDTPPKYPVVYSLDGNWHFPSNAHAAGQLIFGGEAGKMIIVGIGYDTDDDNVIFGLRAWDMLPGNGGAEFLTFLQEELIPYIDTNYLTDKTDRTLAGHSYGGVFALYTLFTATDTFDRYIVMSPALWYHPSWDGERRLIFELEEAYFASQNPANPKLPVQLFLSAAQYDPEDEDWGWTEPRMVSGLIELNDVLESRNYQGLDLDMTIIEGLGHAGGYPGAFIRGLAEVFR